MRSRRQGCDVCIVGSGAGGGMAAYMLTRAGARVVLLETGGEWWSSVDSRMFVWPYETPRRGGSTPDMPFGEHDANIGGWEVDGEPYVRAPGTRFDWFRARMLGGRTNHWGRISLRFGPDDFRRGELDGLSPNWPISYEDLAPWYDEVDRLVGVFGSREGLRNEPDGIFLPPPRPRCYELVIKQGADRLGITCIPSRLSILTQQHNGRAPCHYCGQCGRGCRTNSNFSSPEVLIRPALATGNLTLITNAMAREVTLDARGRANGVNYIDKNTGLDERVDCRVVILAASACESARLLLNSRSSHFSDGLANSSGEVGRNLNDTTGVSVNGFIPRLMDLPAHNEDGVGGGHLYMPWWLDNAALDFPRGYHIELGGGRRTPSYGFMGGIQRLPGGGGYGAQLKQDYRRFWGATVNFSGRGEMVSNSDSYCEIDPLTVDRWGIPALRFHWKWSEYERRQARHMQTTFRSLIEEMGGVPLSEMPSAEEDYGLMTGGSIIHEVGTTRMGADPSRSVVDGWCRTHDVPNLFIADGGPFVTQSDKNPTWTILALSMRTSNHIAELMRAREL